jgi:class 3 adenylate cyclase/tetratricopeptide (TPR) repeat protein
MSITEGSEPARKGSSRESGTLTVLFTDLVGSTAIRQELGDDKADELRRHHDRVVREALAAHGGTEVKGTGDGFMFVFGASAEAIAAATELQRAVTRFNRGSRSPLALRVGLSAGDVAWEDGDCFGIPVIEASRLCDAAEGGQILAADVVRVLTGSRGGHGDRFVPVGPLILKGLADPLIAVEVSWDVPAGADEGGAYPLPAALAVTETVGFVGRHDERLQLITAWKQAQSGERRVVLISGEPGMGKTRLAAEIASTAHDQGSLVLFGRCDDGLAVPYQPFVEAFDAYVARCPAEDLAGHLAEQPTGHGGDLARLLPRLERKVSDLPEPLRAEPESERFRLFEAVRHFLTSIASTTPVVLVIDDLHWADTPTLLLMRHLLREHGEQIHLPLLVVATYRDTELGRDHPLADVLADLRRVPAVERVALRGLSADEVDDFLEAAAGHGLDDSGRELARAVYDETEGNPFFVGQVLRHLVESGALRNVDGHWEATDGVGGIGIPEGVREVIGRRLSRLTPETNGFLAAAAVLGREFDAALLQGMNVGNDEAALDALEEAEQARLIQGVADRVGRYTFAHALVRSTLYDELPTIRRLRLHRRAAETLAAHVGERRVEDVARHYCECAPLGDVDQAVHYGMLAARQAVQRLAYEEAASWFERVLSVLDPDRTPPETRAGLLIELGKSQFAFGDLAAARATLQDAEAISRSAANAELFTRAALSRGGRRGWSEAGLVDEVLIASLEEALGMLPPGDSALRAEASARLASELYFRADEHERRMQLALDAIAMARRVGDTDALAAVLTSATFGRWIPGNAVERIEMSREIVALGEGSGDVETLAFGWAWAQTSLFELGEIEGVREAQRHVDALVAELQRPDTSWMAGVKGAALALFEGRVDDGVALMDAAYNDGQRAQLSTALQMYGVAQLDVAHVRGGVESLAPLAEAMADEYPAIPSWRAAAAFVHAEAGNVPEARRAFEMVAIDDFASVPLDANWFPGLAVLAVAAEFLGDAERATVLYELLLPYAEFFITAGMPAACFGSGHWPVGLAASASGRYDLAVEHLAMAAQRNEAAGTPGWTVRARVDLARTLARRRQTGDVDRASEVLVECATVSRAHEFPRLVERAEEALSRL